MRALCLAAALLIMLPIMTAIGETMPFHAGISRLTIAVTQIQLALPNPPPLQIVPGRHFIFTDICSDSLRLTASETCQDPPGVDRAAVHATVESQIADFFYKYL